MRASTSVITGPARSGKTARLLAHYRRALAQAVAGHVLWIAPTHRSAADIRGRLLGEGLTACFHPGVVTFDGFAESVLQASREPIRPVSDQLARQLIGRLIDTAQHEGRLKHFAPIADTDGLVDLVAAFIRELKRLEIWPDDFQRVCQQRGISAKDRELAAIYRAYQETLTEHQLYDREGRFWSARRMLKDGQQRPYERLRLVVVDGFTDFTRTQHEILEILSQRVEALWISLPLEPETQREDLFAKTHKTLAALRQRHPDLVVEEAARPAESDWPALDHVERELFKSPHDAQPIDSVQRIEVLAASRQLGEIELLGRKIKQLVLHEGVRPADVAVVFRSLTDTAPLVREVFAELGLPVAIEAHENLSAAPPLKALVSLLRLHVENWPFRLLLRVFSSNYFQPDWPEWQQGGAWGHAERVIRKIQIPAGRKPLASALEHWASRDLPAGQGGDASTIESLAKGIAHARVALALVRRLADAFDALPKRATQGEWAAAINDLAQATGLLNVIHASSESSPQSNSDAIAWETFDRALKAGDRLSQWMGESPPQLSAADILQLVTDILRWEALPANRDEAGRIRVLSAPSARALEIPYLYFAGLAEKSVPLPDRDDRLYSDAEYRPLIDQGLPLVDRTGRSQEEMLLFYEVVTRARRRLVLSYPALDEAAQPLLPSSYLIETERACGEGKIPRSEQLDLSPIPQSPEPLSLRELRVKGVWLAVDGGDVKLLAGLLASQASGTLGEHLVAGLAVTHARASGASFGPYEGILKDPSARERLTAQFGPGHVWSASQLEQYANCPHQFFLQRVLELEGLDDLALHVDYMTRGKLLHDALSDVHRRLNASGKPTSPGSQSEEAFLKRFGEVLHDQIASLRSGGPLEPAEREIDRRILTRWGQLYYQQHEKYDKTWNDFDEPPRPAHFEVGFGPEKGPRDERDALATDTPYTLAVEDEAIQIAGRIDRIDVGRLAGQTIFNVLDYKSGHAVSLGSQNIEAGLALQLPLYVMAAQELLLANQDAIPWRSAYWLVRDKGYRDKAALKLAERHVDLVEPSQKWQALREKVRHRVLALVRAVRNAEFPMQSADDKCTSNCPFSTVCRVNQVRALEKSWPPETTDQ